MKKSLSGFLSLPYLQDSSPQTRKSANIGCFSILPNLSGGTTAGRLRLNDCGKLVFLTFSSIADIGEDAFSGDASLRGAWSLQNVTSLGSRYVNLS